MPELPEMETYRRLLERHCQGRRIVDVEINREKSLNVSPGALASAVVGSSFVRFSRLGKMLVLHLESGWALVNHLMLGGALFFGPEAEAPQRTFQVVLRFEEGLALFWTGLRLGWLHLIDQAQLQERAQELGVDPLGADFTLQHVDRIVHGRRGGLKPLLVDQRRFPGVGNCYADEACWRAQVHPLRVAGSLLPHERAALWQGLRETLAEAVALGGYTETPFIPGDRLSGGYLPHLRVYDKQGEPCPRCGAAILLVQSSGRKLFFCPLCQPGAG